MLAHLRKKIFQKDTYNKLKMKNIGPCTILKKCMYFLELHEHLNISLIFNVAIFYEFHEDIVDEDEYIVDWKENIRKHERDETTKILEGWIVGILRSQRTKEYLVRREGKVLK